MDPQTFIRINKVLALTDSAHDGEALAALRVTRNILSDKGMCLSSMLSDVVRASQQATKNVEFVRPSEDIMSALQRNILELQKKISALQARAVEQQTEVHYWRNRAVKAEKALGAAQIDANKVKTYQ